VRVPPRPLRRFGGRRALARPSLVSNAGSSRFEVKYDRLTRTG
jgi:hypothetical protein